jgi:hypothetical protein
MRPVRTIVVSALLAAVALVAAPGPARADDGVEADLEATLHLKVLSYDKKLKARSGGRLVVAVVYRAGDETSEPSRKSIGAAFEKLARKVTVQGMKPEIVQVPFDAVQLGDQLKKARATVVYVAAGLDDAVGTVSAAASQIKAATLTGRRKQVEQGAAVGVVAHNGKPRIVINLKSARALGMDLDVKILSLAEVLK